jgi:hypothetical protein
MPDLVVIIPSRGRPGAVTEIIESFLETCRENTSIIFAVDDDDPCQETYSTAVRENIYIGEVDPDGWRTWERRDKTINAGVCVVDNPTNMVGALNRTAAYVLDNAMDNPKAIGFMGDDHRPRTIGWDTAYLETLRAKPGFVYGNDLHQGRRIPTQVAISAPVVRALGHMAPDVLTHLYVDDYWKNLGTSAGCLTYLPEIVVEHCHPAAGKAGWDPGYARVNDPEMYAKDGTAIREYWDAHGSRDIRLVMNAISKEIGNGDQHV